MQIWFNSNLLNRIEYIKNEHETVKEFIVRAVINYVSELEEKRENNGRKQRR